MVQFCKSIILLSGQYGFLWVPILVCPFLTLPLSKFVNRREM